MDGFECINTNRIDASINSDIASQPVDRFNRSSLLKLTISAPCSHAVSSRDSIVSTAKIRPALSSFALVITN